MKRICKTLVPVLAIIVSVHCYAQDNAIAPAASDHFSEKLYIRAGVGYALPHAGNALNSTQGDFNVKPASFTSGANGVVSCGYMFNNYIGAELGGTVFMPGGKYNYSGPYYSSSYPTLTTLQNVQANEQLTVLLMPGIVLQTQARRFTMYTRLALVLPVVNKTSIDASGSITSSTLEQTSKITDRFTLGFSSAAGVCYKINGPIKIWAEINALAFAPYLKSMELTASGLNGISNISHYPSPSRQTTYGYSGTYITNSTSTSPAFTMPYSNIGILAGVSYNIGERPVVNEQSASRNKYLYLKAGMGYGFPMGDNSSIIESYNGSGTNAYLFSPFTGAMYYNETTFKGKPLSFSAGFSGISGIGYMAGPHIGVELDADGGLNSKKYTYSYSGYMVGNNSPGYYGTDVVYAKFPLLLTPCIVLQTGGKVFNIYSRLGIALPLHSKVYEDEVFKSGLTAETSILNTRFTLGYTGAAGLKYHLTSRWELWGEATLLSYEPFAKNVEFTGFSTNGVTMRLPAPVTNFTRSGTTEVPTYTLPFSSAGIQVGISCRLGSLM